MSDPSMAMILLMVLSPLALLLILCGKKKVVMKTAREKTVINYDEGDDWDRCDTTSDEPKKKKDENADNPMPEADALELVAAIEKGLVRPQKDDESIDDHKTDWGKTQMTGKVGQTGPGTGTEGGLQWKKKN